MKEINVLEILDKMDQFRRNNQHEPNDYCMRVMEAIVAEAAGYESRVDWTDDLRANESSQYSKDLKEHKPFF